MKALPKILLALTGVAALSLAYPASVQASVTYQYIGNPFTRADPPYTTSDFVTVMFTFAGPLAPNTPLTSINPIGFTLSDGVQTIHGNHSPPHGLIAVETGAAGQITRWDIYGSVVGDGNEVRTELPPSGLVLDSGGIYPFAYGINMDAPGTWTMVVVCNGYWVFPIIDDADPYGVGSSGPAVPAGSGLTAPGLAEVALLAFRH